MPILRPHRIPALYALALCLGAGCTPFPQIDRIVDPAERAAPFPDLIPLNPVLAGADAMAADAGREAAATQGVQDRAARLRARAAALRGPVVDAATRARMAAGVRGAR